MIDKQLANKTNLNIISFRNIFFYFNLLVITLQSNTYLFSQKVWTLNECIERAKSVNYRIQEADLNIQSNESKILLQHNSILPTLSANIAPSYGFGRSIDPTTYQFVENSLLSMTPNLSLNFTLSDGRKKRSLLSMAEFESEAQFFDREREQQAVTVEVIDIYLQILLQQEKLLILQDQHNLNQKQYDRVSSQLKAGNDVTSSLLEWQAQLANDEYLLLKHVNDTNLLIQSFAHKLHLPDPQVFEIRRLQIDIPADYFKRNPFEKIRLKALSVLPHIKSYYLRQHIADIRVDMARKSMAPTVSGFLSAGSNYSSLFQIVEEQKLIGYDTTLAYSNQKIILNPQPQYENIVKTPSLFEQFKQNLNFGLGLNISIPIFNSFFKKDLVNQASIESKKLSLRAQKAQHDLSLELLRLYNEGQNAELQYRASNKEVELMKEVFLSAQNKFAIGLINSIEFQRV